MGYQFTNRASGKSQITDESNTTFTLAGINTVTENADSIMAGLSTLLDVVGWSVQDANRIVTQDIEEAD